MKKHLTTKELLISLSLSALMALPCHAENEVLKDVKPPVDLPANLIWIFIALGLLIIVGAWILIRFIKKRFKKTPPPIIDTRMPWQKAFDSFKDLKSSNLLSQGRFNDYYLKLSQIVRQYIEERFHIRAPEMTTEEFLNSLKDSTQLNSVHKQSLKEFLDSSDMVKFAKYAPTILEAEKSLLFAEQLVEETKVKES